MKALWLKNYLKYKFRDCTSIVLRKAKSINLFISSVF